MNPDFVTFPVAPGGKLPARRRFWEGHPVPDGYNVGISTTALQDGTPLLALDVDAKGGRPGWKTLADLEDMYGPLPETYQQGTPTGGAHLIFTAPHPIKSSAGKLGPGLDVRGHHGYVVGAGSRVPAGEYTILRRAPVAPAPDWLVSFCSRAEVRPGREAGDIPDLTPAEEEYALEKARLILAEERFAAQEGTRNDTAFRLACALKDLGFSPMRVHLLMLEGWRTCEPPLDIEEQERVVGNAFGYGREKVGSALPHRAFDPIAPTAPAVEEKKEDWTNELLQIQKVNEKYAWVLVGGRGRILMETQGPEGQHQVRLLDVDTFRTHNAPRVFVRAKETTLSDGTKKRETTEEPLASAWLKSPLRREYEGIAFEPGGCSERYYNMWRGFLVQPAGPRDAFPAEAHDALAAWKDHALVNVCGGDEDLCRWLTGYFAHLVQKPHVKPLTALVFKGKKGVGKNALLGRFKPILGPHYRLVSNRRYLVGQFNGHLERLLMIVLDEAFWSGDKAGEGILKDLVTGDGIEIERKGEESYSVRNLVRPIIVGNERWLVPASEDERRYAVFLVGEGRKQDLGYFERMRVGLDEKGGNRLLLRYLLDFDLTGVEVNRAPRTEALRSQKEESLSPWGRWWLDSLTEGYIVGSPVECWPRIIPSAVLLRAYRSYLRESNIRSYAAHVNEFYEELRKACPGAERNAKATRADPVTGERPGGVSLPSLSAARRQWDEMIGQARVWPEVE